ncbi:hypothetical protein ATANTOWER_022879 [Ataeniobius toweri]|uniref:Uncharacterized protein n=1 Tax=Ataeniobius toweri TaxID=208326 RepID=A0ABU7ASL7_9TELE|nr:hypothetical protein [Ataeniobius toweri]
MDYNRTLHCWHNKGLMAALTLFFSRCPKPSEGGYVRHFASNLLLSIIIIFAGFLGQNGLLCFSSRSCLHLNVHTDGMATNTARLFCPLLIWRLSCILIDTVGHPAAFLTAAHPEISN